jgi:glycosyltransferase involved in cell wall biosynthesis
LIRLGTEMHHATSPNKSIRIHLTNVTGTGASQLLESLLPALVESEKAQVTQIYLPETGLLSKFSSVTENITIKQYRRFLPKAISRFLECTLLAYKFNDSTPILVLGDLPLRVKARQTVFVQTPHLIAPKSFTWHPSGWKYSISRFIFRLNMRRVTAFVVQTDVMKTALIASYPSIEDRVRVVPQPPPRWLLNCKIQKRDRNAKDHNLRLIYPAAEYPHKNHSLLSRIDVTESRSWPVEELLLTIKAGVNPAPSIDWVHCAGYLSPAEMIHAYGSADGILFLSKAESFGFPLVEAMFLGLPVICPNLPYAKTLCGDQGIYFDPNSVESLRAALIQLKELLSDNWKPDWSGQLIGIPKNWESVASKFLDIAINPLSVN